MKNYSIALAFFGFIAISFMTGVSAQAAVQKEKFPCGKFAEVERFANTTSPTKMTYSQVTNAKPIRMGSPARAKVVQ